MPSDDSVTVPLQFSAGDWAVLCDAAGTTTDTYLRETMIRLLADPEAYDFDALDEMSTPTRTTTVTIAIANRDHAALAAIAASREALSIPDMLRRAVVADATHLIVLAETLGAIGSPLDYHDVPENAEAVRKDPAHGRGIAGRALRRPIP